MQFGQKIRELRQDRSLSQRELAGKVGVTFTYISKIENEKIDFGDYPSESLISKLAVALSADEDELLLLAEKIPPSIKKRVLERPDVFCRIAGLDDKALDKLVEGLDKEAGGSRKA